MQYTIAMMGYGPEDKSSVMELTYNYGVTEYDKGNAYAQVTLQRNQYLLDKSFCHKMISYLKYLYKLTS